MNWIDNADSYICPACGVEVSSPEKFNLTCQKCGFVAGKDKAFVNKAMREQRLIDANNVEIGFAELCQSPYFKSDVNAKHGAETLMDLCIRSDSHKPNTIDPETLPIVQELRKELELVTRERDEAVSEIESIIAYGLHLPNTCPFCKNEQCKMRGGTEPCIPKWRGIQEVQEDKQL